jgi:His-Xaa-Ser system radical SAM maturase HxsC
MLQLQGRMTVLQRRGNRPYLVTLTRNGLIPHDRRERYAWLQDGGRLSDECSGFRAILIDGEIASDPRGDVFLRGQQFGYLDEGDIVRLDPQSGEINCLFRAKSRHNTILLTEQCNHYCLMCSQPPKNVDDSWLLDEANELISLIPDTATDIGFSGGEPTLYGTRFIRLIEHTKRCLPRTAVDVLSNGRAFKDIAFAKEYAAVDHPDLLIGIPLYSDDPITHNYVVQADGAFDETIAGILNLKRLKQKVEIRIVIHKQTIERLSKTCEFIARNLLFVDHVALMGLEITGFTRANLDKLWIDPYDYRDQLSEAVSILNSYGMNASVYNHQLCTVNPDVLPNYKKSISDWKNEFLDECVRCSKRTECGGLFSSAAKFKHSSYIRAIA